MVYSEHDPKNRLRKQAERKAKLGLAAIHDASFAGQHDFGSQGGYIIMLGDARLYDELAQTHLIEWHSGKIQRKVASTLASEANAASQAYDRAMWARAICYEIEQGKDSHWEDMCTKIPFCLGTDCKSLYDNIIKPSSTTKENGLLWIYSMFGKGLREWAIRFVGYPLTICWLTRSTKA